MFINRIQLALSFYFSAREQKLSVFIYLFNPGRRSQNKENAFFCITIVRYEIINVPRSFNTSQETEARIVKGAIFIKSSSQTQETESSIAKQ